MDKEHAQLIQYWTRDLNESEIKAGNTYMIRDRIRWTFFMIILAGLSSSKSFQIFIVLLVQILYIMVIGQEIFKAKLFRHIAIKLKYICQEIAILTFLVILLIFALLDSEHFRNTDFSRSLEYGVVVAVAVAIGLEFVSMIWSLITSVKDYFKMK